MSDAGGPITVELMTGESGGSIALLRLNRAEQLNALSRRMLQELALRLNELSSRADIRALVITGSGRAFSAGADLKERAELSVDEVREFMELSRRTFLEIENFPAPVIAALNGYVLGTGLELALAADIRLAARGILIGFPETSLGVIPGAGGARRLAAVIGQARAREMIFTAQRIEAERALEMHLVHRTYTPDDLLAESLRLARSIAANAPLAVSQAKAVLNGLRNGDMEKWSDLESRAHRKTLESRDRAEALNAYLEKRNPVFTGE